MKKNITDKETTLNNLKELIFFVNNYFNDRFFIMVVEDYRSEKYFENAEYTSKTKCLNYLEKFFDLFGSSGANALDKEFYRKYNNKIRKLKLKNLFDEN